MNHTEKEDLLKDFNKKFNFYVLILLPIYTGIFVISPLMSIKYALPQLDNVFWILLLLFFPLIAFITFQLTGIDEIKYIDWDDRKWFPKLIKKMNILIYEFICILFIFFLMYNSVFQEFDIYLSFTFIFGASMMVFMGFFMIIIFDKFSPGYFLVKSFKNVSIDPNPIIEKYLEENNLKTKIEVKILKNKKKNTIILETQDTTLALIVKKMAKYIDSHYK
jgi:hypothetical protein